MTVSAVIMPQMFGSASREFRLEGGTIAEMLGAGGFDCIECADADTALGLAQEPSIGVVVVDMALPRPRCRTGRRKFFPIAQCRPERT